jgi:competence protein ComEA
MPSMVSDDEDLPDLRRLADGPADRPTELLRQLILDLGLSPRSALTAVIVGAVLVAGAWWFWHDPPSSAAEATIPLAQPAGTDAATTTTAGSGEIVAHAAGAVNAPGIYTMAPASRVADLIDAAGGPSPGADLDRVNLAAPLADGAQIQVPKLGEASTGPPIGGEGETGENGGAPASVNVNTADAAELESLSGVGPATAAAIIAHREANGPFPSVDALIEVRGIGDAKLAAFRERVTV